ncbi:sulfurtransferase [Xenophilus arseniciresistens]|uniref:Sulfurtransferase n=1 Tax=Xenophilus arseniciresistens TaxID=1283306 RepID=A0AAE3N7Q8_9BURK|nr:sulfurtransferase [Xenophilus arseniciresistens]MDA7415901.1 sulfurtransferase [Xenophilus arseniciresistens]
MLCGAASGATDIPAGPLVTTDWLAQNLDNRQVRVIEVSVNPGLYERAHVPGAVNFSWHTELNDRVRRDIVGREDFEKLLSKAGVGADTTVVLYGDTNNWFAAWGAWVFDIYGVKNVKLLDGGRRKWEAEGRPLNNRAPEYAATTYRVGTVNTALRARLPDALAAAEGKSNHKLLDIRSADEFSGKVFAPSGVPELAIRAGHIPGAANVAWGQAVKEDGTFKSADELRKLYAAAGVDGSRPVITYCRIGERSSHTWFALSKILGYEVKNYDGSWTEYGNAVGVPISNPAGTVWAAR